MSDTDTPDAEPDQLGAAATLDFERKRRRRRRGTASAPRPEAAAAASGSGIVEVYEAHTAYIPHIPTYLRSLWSRREFLSELAHSQLRSTRSSTALGGIWGLLDPLFQAAIYFFVFTAIRGSGGRPEHFLFVLITTMLLFQISTSALTDGGGSIRQGASLLLNSSFPRALLPLASVYKSILRFQPALLIIVLAHIVLAAPTTWYLLWTPLLFAIQVVMATGFAFGMATITVYLRDAKNLTSYISRVLFFTTPIIVPLSLLERYEEWLIYQPLYALFANYNRVLGGAALDGRLLAISVGWMLVCFVSGSWAFIRREREFASRL